jgi:putative transposase
MHHFPVPAHTLYNAVVALSSLDRVMYGNEPYIPKSQDRDVVTMFHEFDPLREVTLTRVELGELLHTKKIAIHYKYHTPEIKTLDLKINGRVMEDFSVRRQTICLMRQRFVHLWRSEEVERGEKIPRSKVSKDLVARIWGQVQAEFRQSKRCDVAGTGFSTPSIATVNRFFRRYEKHNDNVLALIPLTDGPGRKNTTEHPEALSFATEQARRYLSRTKPSKALVYTMYEAKLLEENKARAALGEPPLHQFGRTKFEQIINSFPKYQVVSSRDGESKAVRHFSPVTRGFDVRRPGQMVQMDEWKTDMFTFFSRIGEIRNIPKVFHKHLKKIRIWIVVIIDVATRYVLGMHFTSTTTGEAAVEAVRMMLTDKTIYSRLSGAQTDWLGRLLPEEMYMDNGPAFTSEVLINTLNKLGISVTRPSAGDAPGRATIESFFGSMGPIWTSFHDGQTFSNIFERGDRDPEECTTLFVEEFAKLATLGVCDVYHRTPHSSLGGMTPHNAFARACEDYGYRHPPGDAQMLHAFGKIATGKISQYGLTRLSIPYGNEMLTDERLHSGQEEFTFKYDPARINSIIAKGRNGWFVVDNLLGFTTDVSEAEWLASAKSPNLPSAKDQREELEIRLTAINRMRRSGEAATLRANFDPIVAEEAELERVRQQIYNGYEPVPSGMSVELISELAIPEDPLHDGGVGPVKFHPVDGENPATDVAPRSQFDGDDLDI